MFIILLTELETYTITNLYQQGPNRSFILTSYSFKILLILLSIVSLAFSIVKLIFVLQKSNLDALYLSSIYIFLVFSSIEFIGFILMIPYLTRIKLLEQEKSKVTKKKVDFRRLLQLAKSESLLISAAGLFLFISSATQVIQPYFFGKIIDYSRTSKTMHEVNVYVLLLFGINAVGAIATIFRAWFFELAGQYVKKFLYFI